MLIFVNAFQNYAYKINTNQKNYIKISHNIESNH